MALFKEKAVQDLVDSNLNKAKERLASLGFCPSGKVCFGGLTGWVFEQTIHYCLCKELEARGIRPKIEEQKKVVGRANADLKIGPVFLEIKEKGLFDPKAPKRYRRYARAAQRNGCTYFFLTLRESYLPYTRGTKAALGHKNSFFLYEGKSNESSADWQRFIDRVLEELQCYKEANKS
jgi:hypothetical protein